MELYAGGYLTFYMPGQQAKLDYPLNRTMPLVDLLQVLGIPAGDVQLVVINGKAVMLNNARVQDRDHVKIFSAIGGG